MKHLITLFIICILSFFSAAQSCDSIRLIHHSRRVDASTSWTFLTIDTIVDGQIISSTNQVWNSTLQIFQSAQTTYYQWDTIGSQIRQTFGTNRITFENDNSGRLIIREKANFDGLTWNTNQRLEKYYTSFDRDSLQLLYSYPGGLPDLSQRFQWQYDGLFRIVRKTTEAYLNSTFQITEDIFTDYPSSTPNVVRADSFYINYGGGLQLEYAYAYTYVNADSLDYSIYGPPFNILDPVAYFTGTVICNDTLWERISATGRSGSWKRGSYNSDCLPLYFDVGSGSLSSGTESDISEYSYLNCNMIGGFISAQSKNICQGDTILLAANIYGGVPPYDYEWTSSRNNMHDTVSHPLIIPDSTTTYYLTVRDANNVQATGSVVIQVNKKYPANLEIISVDSLSNCSSAQLIARGASGAAISWTFDHHYFQTTTNGDSIIQAKYAGWYFITVSSGICPSQYDSIEVNNLPHPYPYLTFSTGCNQMIAHALGSSQVNWYNYNDSIAISVGDTLSISTNGYYEAVAIDSTGCTSNKAGAQFKVFKINPSFQNACNDSCMGIAGVYVEPSYLTFSYQWSNGDTLSFTDSLCNSIVSVTVTDRDGCQLTAIDSCLGVSIFEIDNVRKSINIFPNPASTVLHLDLMNTDFNFPIHWQVMDVFGRIIDELVIQENNIKLDENIYSSGLYIFRITKDSKYKGGGKFIVRKN